MDSLMVIETAVKRRRLTITELSEILGSVATKRKSRTACLVTPVAEKIMSKVVRSPKPRKYYSKIAALGAQEKILALVALNPKWGTQRLAKSLAEQGISLSRQSIHKILLKYNLNHPAMRKEWHATQKETNP